MSAYKLNFFTAIALLAASYRICSAQSLDFPSREAATVGVCVVDLSSGNVVASENVNQAMIPASTLKCLTSATVLNLYGPSFSYRTKTVINGEINNGIAGGDLIVMASGDPTVASELFGDSVSFVDAIVSGVRSLGIKKIAGDVIVDDSWFSDGGQNPQWVIEDVGWAYGAGVYGFNYADNTFRYFPASGKSVPQVPFINVDLEPSKSATDIVHGINSDNYIISGRYLANKRYSVTTVMNSPSAVAALEIRTCLEQAGIEIVGDFVKPTGKVTEVCVHVSPPLSDILRVMMFRSQNMYAEAMLRLIDISKSRSQVIKSEMDMWSTKGLDTRYIKVYDGSGLSRTSRLTPKFLADLLVNMASSERADDYTSLFPVVGRDGTVKSLFKNSSLQGRFALKTGSMNGVMCFAGYRLNDDRRPTHTVVIMVNNFFCSRDVLRKAIQSWLTAIF